MLRPRRRLSIRISDLLPGVLIFVTVDTQQLPVTAIGWIVVVVMVSVMDRQLAEFFAAKFTSAAPTNPRIQLEGLLPIALLLLRLIAPRLGNNLVLSIEICGCLL